MINQNSTLKSRSERELNSFYSRIRSQLKELDPEGNDQNDEHRIKATPNDIAEENIFGNITKEEFESVLDSYGEQQKSSDLKDSPVTCDKVTGHSYAKLLFSKTGFHHIGSTQHIVTDLGIKDTNRSSFLAGLSSYEITSREDVKGLRKSHLRLSVKAFLDKAKDHIDREEPDFIAAKHNIDEAFKLNPRSADALAVRGRYHFINKNHRDAQLDFKQALKGELEDECLDLVKLKLSESLFEYGMSFYYRNEHVRARTLFIESLQYNPRNEPSELHLKMIEDKLKNHRFQSSGHSYRG